MNVWSGHLPLDASLQTTCRSISSFPLSFCGAIPEIATKHTYERTSYASEEPPDLYKVQLLKSQPIDKSKTSNNEPNPGKIYLQLNETNNI